MKTVKSILIGFGWTEGAFVAASVIHLNGVDHLRPYRRGSGRDVAVRDVLPAGAFVTIPDDCAGVVEYSSGGYVRVVGMPDYISASELVIGLCEVGATIEYP